MITKRNVLRKKNWEYTEKFISLTLITVCYVFLFFTSCKPGKQNSINLLLLLLNSLDNKNINAESENSTNANPNDEENENSINADPNQNVNVSSSSDSSGPLPPNKNLISPTSSNSNVNLDSTDVGIKILSQNVFMVPTDQEDLGQEARAQRIASSNYIKKQDIIVFEGLFHYDARKILLEKIRSEYPYQTDVVGSTKNGWNTTFGAFTNHLMKDGGVIIVSKWPIEEKIQYIFNNLSCGQDQYYNKGFAYVKINKNGKKFHVIGTQLQARESDCFNSGETIRKLQIKNIKDFIYSKNIPKDETVLIAGDLNVVKGSNEYFDMISRLNVNEPKYVGVPFTLDTKTNAIASYYYENQEPIYLDYIFVSKSHAQPSVWQNLAYDPISSTTWKRSDGYTSYEFSDRYPVYGFVYADSSTPTKSGHKRTYDQVSFQSTANGKFIQADPNRKDGWLKADATTKTDFTKFNLLQESVSESNPSCMMNNGSVRIESSYYLNYYWNWFIGAASGDYGYHTKFNDASNNLGIRNLDNGCLKNGSRVAFYDWDTVGGGYHYITVWDRGSWKEYLFLWVQSFLSAREIFYLYLDPNPPKDWSQDLIYHH
ncbi:sphingomyelin phosphodiesterase [Leptospira kirschneri]|uniref:sphingomyelin phosphodiesterase n=1 Tax=Leptospira kirschneri TaxID=29507 RepID=UPI0002784453|nr:sphingomyelin phosphodiesterase [Leptospira kirschneri]EJO68053.1 sphingomyelin phosphodiesterase [Leptospira kirschneri serovar Grippotyphosa str. RM52]EMK08006.1 sphingomyelin phosphodiesterase [Leptospira kirschneri str. MMD1493]EMK18619.1 sphingomyelin phosphodiesterase [Leptospira kirschneri serovar Bim str. PUO 1247]EMN05296.1 sphingomyelin phosphodiesterase [Leptospira kirschneri serovar Bim str. 1051]